MVERTKMTQLKIRSKTSSKKKKKSELVKKPQHYEQSKVKLQESHKKKIRQNKQMNSYKI